MRFELSARRYLIRVLPVLVTLSASAANSATAQTPPSADTVRLEEPADTYADDHAQALIALARTARGKNVQGIEHYEATLRERIYVGLGGRVFRRERGLFDQQRLARVRWESSGDQIIQWLGLRARVPIMGDESGAGGDVEREIHEALGEDGDPIPISLDPNAFDIAYGEAVHPLADTAASYYRYASGDTLFLTLPADGRRVTMGEVRVEPREDRFDLIAASLWFDISSGELVRAVYRPARPFDLELDEPEDAEDVPGILRPIQAELKYVTIDYGLYEFRYWLPRRFALEGEGRAGGFLKVPITLEWSLRDYLVNEATSELVQFAGRLPPGWTRSEVRVEDDDGAVRYVTLLVPPVDSVLAHPELVDVSGDTEPLEFDSDELAELRGVLDEIDPSVLRAGPTLRYGVRDGLVRFNRVEGLSLGARAELPLTGRTKAYAEARLGVADLEPNAELGVHRGQAPNGVHLALYRRLDHTADFENPLDATSSFSALVFGDDRAQYFRTVGAEAGWAGETRRTRSSLRALVERHSSANRETTFHLFKAFRPGSVPPNIGIETGDYAGLSGRVNWFEGTDPARLSLFGTLGLEGGYGLDAERGYVRGFASVGATRALFAGVAGAVEVGGGRSEQAPLERGFFLGGASTLRGFPVGAAVGERFAFARAELATAFPAARVTLFTDVAGAASDDTWFTAADLGLGDDSLDRSLSWNGARASVGVGVSFLDGIIRIDGAWAVKNGSGFRLHAYLDGLF